jgi:hypothetical protein
MKGRSGSWQGWSCLAGQLESSESMMRFWHESAVLLNLKAVLGLKTPPRHFPQEHLFIAEDGRPT